MKIINSNRSKRKLDQTLQARQVQDCRNIHQGETEKTIDRHLQKDHCGGKLAKKR